MALEASSSAVFNRKNLGLLFSLFSKNMLGLSVNPFSGRSRCTLHWIKDKLAL